MIDEEIKTMLLEGEQVLLVASQSQILPGGSLFTPNTVYITEEYFLKTQNGWD